MPVFGGFETVRELAQNGPVVICTARPRGSAAPAAGGSEPNVIKSIEPAVNIIGQDQAREAAALFLDAASVQKQLASSGSWAPIIESDTRGGGAYYVTKFYRRSLQQIIDLRMPVRHAALHRIATGIVAALNVMQKEMGRPHGNLKHGNCFLKGEGDLSSADVEVVLADPAPSKLVDRASGYSADLRALGEIICQLARRRPGASIGEPADWKHLGSAAEAWRRLTSRLLDPTQVGLLNLDTVEKELGQIVERGGVLTKPIWIAAAVLLIPALGISAYLLLGGGKPTAISGPAPIPTEWAEWVNGYIWCGKFFNENWGKEWSERDPYLARNVREPWDKLDPNDPYIINGGKRPHPDEPPDKGGDQTTNAVKTIRAIKKALVTWGDSRLSAKSKSYPGRGWHRQHAYLQQLVEKLREPGKGEYPARALSAIIDAILNAAPLVDEIEEKWILLQNTQSLAETKDPILDRFSQYVLNDTSSPQESDGSEESLRVLGNKLDSSIVLLKKLQAAVNDVWPQKDKPPGGRIHVECFTKECSRKLAAEPLTAEVFGKWLSEARQARFAVDPQLNPFNAPSLTEALQQANLDVVALKKLEVYQAEAVHRDSQTKLNDLDAELKDSREKPCCSVCASASGDLSLQAAGWQKRLSNVRREVEDRIEHLNQPLDGQDRIKQIEQMLAESGDKVLDINDPNESAALAKELESQAAKQSTKELLQLKWIEAFRPKMKDIIALHAEVQDLWQRIEKAEKLIDPRKEFGRKHEEVKTLVDKLGELKARDAQRLRSEEFGRIKPKAVAAVVPVLREQLKNEPAGVDRTFDGFDWKGFARKHRDTIVQAFNQHCGAGNAELDLLKSEMAKLIGVVEELRKVASAPASDFAVKCWTTQLPLLIGARGTAEELKSAAGKIKTDLEKLDSDTDIKPPENDEPGLVLKARAEGLPKTVTLNADGTAEIKEKEKTALIGKLNTLVQNINSLSKTVDDLKQVLGQQPRELKAVSDSLATVKGSLVYAEFTAVPRVEEPVNEAREWMKGLREKRIEALRSDKDTVLKSMNDLSQTCPVWTGRKLREKLKTQADQIGTFKVEDVKLTDDQIGIAERDLKALSDDVAQIAKLVPDIVNEKAPESPALRKRWTELRIRLIDELTDAKQLETQARKVTELIGQANSTIPAEFPAVTYPPGGDKTKADEIFKGKREAELAKAAPLVDVDKENKAILKPGLEGIEKDFEENVQKPLTELLTGTVGLGNLLDEAREIEKIRALYDTVIPSEKDARENSPKHKCFADYKNTLGPAIDRATEVLDLAQKNLDVLRKEAQTRPINDDPAYAVNLWREFGRMITVDNLQTERTLEAAVKAACDKLNDDRKKAVLEELDRESKRRWEDCLRAVLKPGPRSRKAIDDILDLRSTEWTGLSPWITWNIELRDLMKKAEDTAAASADPAKESELLQAIKAGVTTFTNRSNELGNLLERKTGLLDRIQELAQYQPGEDDPTRMGPGDPKVVPEWTGRRDDDTVTFTLPGDNTHTLTFMRFDGKGGPSYLCTSEVSVGLFCKITNASGLQLPSRSQKGPCAWEVANGKLQLSSRGWLMDGSLRDSGEKWDAKPPAKSCYSDKIDVKPPSEEHPVQHITAECAKTWAQSIGCRLPTANEWTTGYQKLDPDQMLSTAAVRGSAWRIQWDYAKNLVRNFMNEGFIGRFPKLPPKDDGATIPDAEGPIFWFTEVSSGAQTLCHMIGNVAEFVFDEDGGYGVIGGSSLSPLSQWGGMKDGQHIGFDTRYPIAEADLPFSYSDVGFRLAFKSEKKSLKQLVEALIDPGFYIVEQNQR